MNDLIRRKDAIDSPVKMVSEGLEWIPVYHIKELPSAEPERKLELHGDESAIEILSELRSWFSCFDEKEGLAYHALSLAIRAIKANSIVQAERKTGKWVKDNYGNTACSECLGIRRDNRINYINFCNQCGADMRGEKDR